MKLGFGLPAAGAWATPENLGRVARHAEALGYRSLWVFQRLLYPLRPKDEYYGAPGGAWPEAFRSVLDPLATLVYVAALTRTVRLGVSVLIMPFDPNFQPGGPALDPILAQMESLAPA